jgi:hypothetical protein
MLKYILLATILTLPSCQDSQKITSSTPSSISSNTPKVDCKESNILTPGDLGIDKQTYTAHPNADEVAIFRVERIDNLEPRFNMIYDQLFWVRDQKEVSVNVLLAPMSFYKGYPEPEKDQEGNILEESIFRDSWKLQAGMFSHDIDKYTFLNSSHSSGRLDTSLKIAGFDSTFQTSTASGDLVYTKNSQTKTEDLVFKFTMFIVSLEQAHQLHPEFDPKIDESTNSRNSAFILETTK